MKPAYFKFSFIIVLSIVFVLAFIHNDYLLFLEHYDKFNHIVAFIVLSFLIEKSFTFSFYQNIFILLFIGLFLEIIQIFTPTRFTDIADMFANCVGIFLYFIGIYLLTNTKGELKL